MKIRAIILAGVVALWAGAAASGPQPAASELAGRLGCFACHALAGRGGKIAAPLDGVGARLTPAQLQTVLTRPRQIHPRAKMPSYAYLPQEEQQALVEFLQGLR